MDFTQASHRIIAFFVGAGFVTLLVFWIVLWDNADAVEELKGKKINKIQKELRPFFRESGNTIDISTEKLVKQNKAIETQLNSWLENANLLIPDSFKLNPGEKQPEFFFKQHLAKARESLGKRASAANADVPYDLGFGEELPKADQVPDMLNRLLLVRRVIAIMIDSGFHKVDQIDIKRLKVAGPTEETKFLEVLPVRVDSRCSTEALVKFLHTMERSHHGVMLSDVKIISDFEAKSEARLKASLTFVVLKSVADGVYKQEKPKDKKTKSKRPNIILPKGV